MENLTDNLIINEMLEVDKNASIIINEAKEEGNRIVKQARKETKQLIELTKEEIENDYSVLEKRLKKDAEERINNIILQKESLLKEIEKKAELKNGLALKKVKNFLFESVLIEYDKKHI